MTRFDLFRRILAFAVTAALLAACGDDSSDTKTSAESEETSTAQTDGADAEPLPAEPQEVQFQAADGQSLQGIYYPASTLPAPVVVLFHWAGGDLSDWYEVAPWLQNRGVTNPFTNPGSEPWWDPSWFPSATDAVPVGVFIITLRDCAPWPTGCQQFEGQGWLLDAQAALAKAATLDGADPERIAAMGSSIGADAAVDACFWLNEETPGSCDGALSLSPGSFLDVPYPTAVENLGGSDPAVPAWCLASADEIAACEAAEDAGNTAFQTFEIAEGRHGNELMIPPADPSTMQTMLDFLALIFAG
jgi:hypothetical protein